MAIYAGRYTWDGKKNGQQEPIAWSPGSYDIKIFKCTSSLEKVQHLKPFICIYAATGEGQSISANPEKFAKHICHDFSLDIERVLWIEDLLTTDNRYEVINFSRSTKVGDTIFYRADKRMALAPEVRMIQQELKRLETLVS